MGAALSPPCFLTTLQYTKLHGVQVTRSHLYIIMQKHTRTHMFIVGEKLWASLFSRDSNEHIMLNTLTNLQGFTLCFVDCKCKSLKRLGENINENKKKQKTNRQTRRQTENTTEIHNIQPSTRPRKNISQVPAGRFLVSFLFVVLLCCSCFLRVVLFVFMFL